MHITSTDVIHSTNSNWNIMIMAENKTYYIVSSDTIRPIDDYTLFKLSERRYVPQLHYTVNILKLN